ncbi:rhomboid family intramembrane serine protease [Flavobacterium sp. XS2P14]|uniref:rhomboid family intramembrane serine protease n=1 Tax=unclassified Flavobacterium TaxID=196869 RepID=UPI003AB0EA87
MNTVLIALIVVNVLLSYKGFNDISFFRKYEFHVGSIRSGEQIRMLSSGFLHADMTHLIFNMLTLWFFAPVVVSYLGDFSFLMIYFGSLIFGSLLTMFFHKDEYGYRAVGASGAVTGVIFSSILLDTNLEIFGFIPGIIYGFVFLLSSIYGMKAKNDNIGHTAHFGGAIGGYLITLLKEPSLLVDHTLMVVLLAIPIIILFVMEKLGKI